MECKIDPCARSARADVTGVWRDSGFAGSVFANGAAAGRKKGLLLKHLLVDQLVLPVAPILELLDAGLFFLVADRVLSLDPIADLNGAGGSVGLVAEEVD